MDPKQAPNSKPQEFLADYIIVLLYHRQVPENLAPRM